jgi:branched-chain amino acid transport system permease protein
MFHEFLILQLGNFVIPATILVIIALGLNVQWGHTGLFNAGVAAFLGIGAYTFGMLSTGFLPRNALCPGCWGHWGPPVPFDIVSSALVAMVLASLIGTLVAVPTLRLRADYLAIATLALAEIVRLILKNERNLTGGDQALSLIPRPFGTTITAGWASDGVFMLIVAGLLLAILILLERLATMPWGRSLRAVREDEEAAMALGRDAFRLRLSAFAVGCAIMGLGGALMASLNRVIVPDNFAPFVTFNAFIVVILGGSGNHRGVILGGYLFYLFGWTTQQIKAYVPLALALRVDYFNLIVVGVLLVVLVLFRPEGVMPEPKYVPPQKRR